MISPKTQKPKKVKFLMGFLLVILVIALIYLVRVFFFSSEDTAIGQSNVQKMGRMIDDVTPSEALTGNQATPDMRERIAAKDKADAIDAMEKGESTFPTVVLNNMKPEPLPKSVISSPDGVTPQVETQPKVQKATLPAEYRVEQIRPASRSKEDRLDLQNMVEAMKAIQNSMKMAPAKLISVKATNENKKDTQTTNPQSKALNSTTTLNTADAIQKLLTPGKVVYAINEYNINSDSPKNDVVARVLSPVEIEYGRFFGKFTRYDESLVLEFTRFVYQGKEYNIRAIAINPTNADIDVATDVNTHFIERWGGLFLSSFIEGVGDAVANSGSTTTISSGTVVQTKDKSTTRDIILEGAGTVGSKASSVLQNNFNRPPTVKMRPGADMGILILEAN